MRHTLIVLLLVCASIMKTECTRAQWKQTNGPLGGRVQCLAATDSHVFAGVYAGGVYRAALDGSSWTPVNAGMDDLNVLALTVSGKKIFAGTYSGGVFLSTDEGASWSPVNSGLVSPNILSLAATGTTLIAGTAGYGVFISTNDGASWRQGGMRLGAGSVSVYALLAHGDTILAGGSSGISRSTDAGATWTRMTNGLPASTGYNALAATGSAVFAGTSEKGVYRSADGGMTWSAASNGLTGSALVVYALMNAAGVLYAGTNGGVYRSTNDGQSWDATVTDFGSPGVLSLAGSSTNLYAGSMVDGPLVSDVNGSSWKLSQTGMNNSYVASLASSGGTLIAANFSGVSLSGDNGFHWTQCGTGSNAIPAAAVAVFGKTVLIGGYGAISRSKDQGRTWSAAAVPAVDHEQVVAFAFNGSAYFAATQGRYILRSLDEGATWVKIATGLTNAYTGKLAVMGNEIFSGGYRGIYRSADNGETWSAVNNSPFRDEEVTALISMDSVVIASAGVLGIFRSADKGASWEWVGLGLNCYVTNFAVFNAHLFASGSVGVYVSDDRGTTWRAVWEGLAIPDVIALAVAGPNLFVGPRFGSVWRRPLSEMVSGMADHTVHIEQNFPNPFNTSTTITYTLPAAEQVSLKVFDLLGREVETIASGEFPAGNYSSQWNASRYPSGVYFYRLQAGAHTETKRLLLLK